jgi:hypothetical protein
MWKNYLVLKNYLILLLNLTQLINLKIFLPNSLFSLSLKLIYLRIVLTQFSRLEKSITNLND